MLITTTKKNEMKRLTARCSEKILLSQVPKGSAHQQHRFLFSRRYLLSLH